MLRAPVLALCLPLATVHAFKYTKQVSQQKGLSAGSSSIGGYREEDLPEKIFSRLTKDSGRLLAPQFYDYALGWPELEPRFVHSNEDNDLSDAPSFVPFKLADDEKEAQLPVRAYALTNSIDDKNISDILDNRSDYVQMLSWGLYTDRSAGRVCNRMRRRLETYNPWMNHWTKDQYAHMYTNKNEHYLIKWIQKAYEEVKADRTNEAPARVLQSCLTVLDYIVRGHKGYADLFLKDFDAMKVVSRVINLKHRVPEGIALRTFAHLADMYEPGHPTIYNVIPTLTEVLTNPDNSDELSQASQNKDAVAVSEVQVVAEYWNALTAFVCHDFGFGAKFVLGDLARFQLVSQARAHNERFNNTEVQANILHVMSCWLRHDKSFWMTDDLVAQDTLTYWALYAVAALRTDNYYWGNLRSIQLLAAIAPLSNYFVQILDNKGTLPALANLLSTVKVRTTPPYLPDVHPAAARLLYELITRSKQIAKRAVDYYIPMILVESHETHEKAGKRYACLTMRKLAMEYPEAHRQIWQTAKDKGYNTPPECGNVPVDVAVM